MQDKEQRKAFAHDERNLTLTDRGLNRSKGSAPLTDPNVEKRLKTKNGLDKRRAGPKQKRGEAAVRERLPDLGQQSAYYAQTLTASTTGAAVNVGLSQAIGLVIAELAGAIFDEAKDIFGQGLRGGRVDASFFQVLRERITRIAARVLSKWEDAVSAFRQGALAGLVSTVSTWLINWIVTAAAHVVRIIREGTMSLVSAIKLLLWPPEGFTPAQALHEASKVLLTGAVITGGILLDELIAKLPVVQGIPFGGTISSVVVGVVSGFVMVCGVYLLDKLDLFGAIAGQRQDHVFKVLGARFEDAYERAEHHLEVLAPVQLLPS